MTQTPLDIVYAGRVVEGADVAQVKTNLAKLFKLDGAAIERLFSGTPVVIKRGVDRQTALKYQMAMKKAGALCELRKSTGRAQHAGPAAERRTDAAQAGPSAGEQRLADATLAPAGVVIVESRPITAPVFNLSAFSLAEPGADVLSEVPPAPARPLPDTEGLSMDPPGVDLVEHPTIIAAPLPDTSAMSIAEAGADLDTTPTVAAPPPPDVRRITLAPPGTDLVSEDGVQPPPPLPDTDSLSLVPKHS